MVRLAYAGSYLSGYNLYIVDLTNGQIQQITTDEQGGGTMPAWSPDGRIAYVFKDQSYDRDIAIYDLVKTAPEPGLKRNMNTLSIRLGRQAVCLPFNSTVMITS